MEVHSTMFAAAQELHRRFRHRSAELIATDIFQSQRLQSATKNVGKYNAFVSLECKRLNAGKLTCATVFVLLILKLSTEIPEGQPRQKVNELAKKIGAKWSAMSDEEKIAATTEELAHLRERRANREVGEHRVAATAAQDSFLTLERVQENVSCLSVLLD